jgi:hypothetical protein
VRPGWLPAGWYRAAELPLARVEPGESWLACALDWVPATGADGVLAAGIRPVVCGDGTEDGVAAGFAGELTAAGATATLFTRPPGPSVTETTAATAITATAATATSVTTAVVTPARKLISSSRALMVDRMPGHGPATGSSPPLTTPDHIYESRSMTA